MKRLHLLTLFVFVVMTMVVASCGKGHKSPTAPATLEGQELPGTTENPVSDGSDNIDRSMAGATSCGGQSSPGNPYPCCSNGGNCTWWVWKQAKDVWGVSLPGMGNANTWASYARSYGYPVSSTPTINTIAVSLKGATGWGHVAWVTNINTNGTIQVSEMNCDYGGGGVKYTTYKTSYFDGGFIANKSGSGSTGMKIFARLNMGKCLHKKYDGWGNGNPIHVWDCAPGPAENKTFIYEPSTGYLRSPYNPGMCFHKKAPGWDNGNIIHLWNCNEGPAENKSWNYDSNSGKISARYNPGKCFHKKYWGWTNGNPIHLWDCNVAGADENMKWTIQ
jgi:surface antigen